MTLQPSAPLASSMSESDERRRLLEVTPTPEVGGRPGAGPGASERVQYVGVKKSVQVTSSGRLVS